MPSKRNTPPEKRRAPRGSHDVKLPLLGVPQELADALAELAAAWECSVAEARRRCYRDARLRLAARGR